MLNSNKNLMENYSYSTNYPDSGNSSPRSREIDSENASWDEPPSNYKVRFMCSYGGKIHPRPHDNHLTYVGGDTKILAVDRNLRFSAFIAKLSSVCDVDVCFKYQLPGEDLDALISVTNDEDLEHMMQEYDRLFRASARPARMRLFLFPITPTTPSSFASTDTKSERQWFVDALNSVQITNLDDSTPTAAVASGATPDFLFGLEKSHAPSATVVTKLQDPTPEPTIPETFHKEIRAGSECGSEDHHVLRDPALSPSEMQRQMHEFQRFQIASHEQALFQRKTDEANARAYYGEYYSQKAPEKIQPVQQPVPVAIQAPYWQESRQVTPNAYSGAMVSGNEQVYLMPSSAGMYQNPAMRPVTGQVSQGYYGMQRMVPEIHREQQVYNVVPQQSIQQQRAGTYSDPSGIMRPAMGTGVGMTEHGYAQVGYDAAGRQVYYAAAPRGMVPTYQQGAAAPDNNRQDGVMLNQEGKVVANASNTSSV